jgi:LytR cell envelope-related transcriptional attenuator
VNLIEQIGSVTGLLAFIGLAVLAVLYFSQARDLRRLREWAGRAPERAAAAAEQTSVAYSQQAEVLRDEAPRERRRQPRSLPEPRYMAVVAGGVLILGIGLIVGVGQLLGGGDDGGQKSAKSGAVDPGKVEVAILNGTAVPGLAAQVGDDVERAGFKVGAVTNSESAFSETLVMYERGHEKEAQTVASGLGVSGIQPVSQEIAGVSDGAPVAVVVGDDRANP